MKKLIKLSLIWITPIVILLFLIFSSNVLLTDFRYAHQSSLVYNGPFPWAKYYLKVPLKKFFINLTNNQDLGLERTHVYLPEQSERKLLSGTPNSTKYWVNAHIANNKSKIQKIKLRYRGDNPSNWLFEKKSIRIKSRKKELLNRVRYFDYHPITAETFASAKVSELMNIIVQKPKLVELYLNGSSDGIFVEYEKLNENFLRRNKLMPVNFYKGENHATEKYIGVDENLFNNPSLWSKIATFNKFQDKNKDDLTRFLSTVHKYEYSELFDPTLEDYIDIKNFSKFSSYLTLTQNPHHDYFHNMRLIIDPWSGRVTQVITDGSVLKDVFGKFSLDFSSNDLNALLHRSSVFNHEKYKWIYEYTYNEDVFEKYKKFYQRTKPLIEVSAKRDPDNSYNKILNDFDLINKNLINNKKKLKAIFDSKPNAFWNYKNDKLFIHVDGYMPISNITINFNKSNTPKWISIDENLNNIVDNNEKKFYIENNQSVNVPVVLYSNRYKHTLKKTSMHKDNYIYNSSTKFKLIVENGSSPNSIEASNPFTKKTFKVSKNNNNQSVIANKYNQIIYKNNSLSNKLVDLSGEIEINKDTVFNYAVNILPGTKFNIAKNSNIIFKNKVVALGTKEEPIIFKNSTSKKNFEPWGTVALIGSATNDSILNNVRISGGSGGVYKQYYFTSMFSLHNTQNIKIKNAYLENNHTYDDMIHIVYCKNIILDNVNINNAYSDAVDVDVSENIIIKNSVFTNPVNDSLDFMESEAKVLNTQITGSGDKGISIGENSNILIKNVLLKNNDMGIAIKDLSKAKILNTSFDYNKIQISAYSKNWQYGGGGKALILNSNLTAETNNISSSNRSKISIQNSKIKGKKKIEGTTVTIN